MPQNGRFTGHASTQRNGRCATYKEEAAGSNPVSPTYKTPAKGLFLQLSREYRDALPRPFYCDSTAMRRYPLDKAVPDMIELTRRISCWTDTLVRVGASRFKPVMCRKAVWVRSLALLYYNAAYNSAVAA